jgi:hypothetical protein
MASRFTALPLRTGESFVLETDHDGKRWVILYDGGQRKCKGTRKNELFQLLRKHCPEIKDHIDIAVCSHSDIDHSGGFPDFVATWTSEGNTIGEFWLPALWSPALPDVLINPDRLIARLADGALQAVSEIVLNDNAIRTTMVEREGRSEYRSIEQQLHDNAIRSFRDNRSDRVATLVPEADISEENSRRFQVASSLGLDVGSLEIIQNNLEESSTLTIPMTERQVLRSREPWLWPEDFAMAETLQARHTHLNSVLETADTIQKIATVAATNEIPIRWFDFTPFEAGVAPSGGFAKFFQPLNTIEVKGVKREADNLMFFFSLKLTEQNVSSLVFQRVEESSEPSVIFVADSRLAFGIDKPERDFPKHLTPPTKSVIFTAAHHGSRNNDRAYVVLKDWLGADLFQKSVAVRNGGVHNQTLADYLKIENRRCAQCYQCHGGDWNQLVRVETLKDEWIWPPNQGGKCGVPKRKTP